MKRVSRERLMEIENDVLVYLSPAASGVQGKRHPERLKRKWNRLRRIARVIRQRGDEFYAGLQNE